MAFDYKKAYKDLYLPPRQPHILDVPPMNFLAVRGTGDPNAEGGAYQAAMGLLYGVAFTIKMSKLGSLPCHRGILRLCGTAPGGLMVAGGTDGP